MRGEVAEIEYCKAESDEVSSDGGGDQEEGAVTSGAI